MGHTENGEHSWDWVVRGGCSEEVAEDKCAGRENSLDTGPEVGRAWALSFWPEACVAMEHELGPAVLAEAGYAIRGQSASFLPTWTV